MTIVLERAPDLEERVLPLAVRKTRERCLSFAFFFSETVVTTLAAAFVAPLAGVLAFVALILGVFVVTLLRAPVQQRDAARTELRMAAREQSGDRRTEIVEKELAWAWGEAQALMSNAQALHFVAPYWDRWVALTAEYIGEALGPTARARFENLGETQKRQIDFVHSAYRRLMEIAGELDESEIRLGAEELREAGSKRRQNGLVKGIREWERVRQADERRREDRAA